MVIFRLQLVLCRQVSSREPRRGCMATKWPPDITHEASKRLSVVMTNVVFDKLAVNSRGCEFIAITQIDFLSAAAIAVELMRYL